MLLAYKSLLSGFLHGNRWGEETVPPNTALSTSSFHNFLHTINLHSLQAVSSFCFLSTKGKRKWMAHFLVWFWHLLHFIRNSRFFLKLVLNTRKRRIFSLYPKLCMKLYSICSYLGVQVMFCSDKVAQFTHTNATPWASAIVCKGQHRKSKRSPWNNHNGLLIILNINIILQNACSVFLNTCKKGISLCKTIQQKGDCFWPLV